MKWQEPWCTPKLMNWRHSYRYTWQGNQPSHHIQYTPWMVQILVNGHQSQNKPRCVSEADVHHTWTVPWCHWHLWQHFNLLVSNEDHNANLINLLSICQKGGLVQNSKKVELWWERVYSLALEYSAEGMHPDINNIQGIVEITVMIDEL